MPLHCLLSSQATLMGPFPFPAAPAPAQRGACSVFAGGGEEADAACNSGRHARACSSSRQFASLGGLRQGAALRLKTCGATSRSRLTSTRCQSQKVKLRLRLDHQVRFGDHHALTGSAESIGSWSDRVAMRWTSEGWVADIEADPGQVVEYKYVIVTGDGNVVWEAGPNRSLELPKQDGGFEVVSHWDQTQEQIDITVLGGSSPEAGPNENGSFNTHLQQRQQEDRPVAASSEDNIESTSFVQGWQGREVNFMRSNEHSGQRGGKWETSSLEGPALKVVEGDRSASNWWRKLEVVRDLITSDLGKTNRLESLVYSAIYLKWINTGQVQCHEDGSHHRPNKHAEISRLIFRELEKIVTEKDVTPKELVVVRNIHPTLPAFKAEFTAAVPLTRIRDIAHRNDIPHDLKQEIKHTIQNKLHRNAGPEDLVATEVLLARVTKKSGEYSEAFLEQLKIFYSELKDFFNAGNLTEQLEGVRPSLDEQQSSALGSFLSKKKKLDEQGQTVTNDSAIKGTDSLIGTLHSLTGLRAGLLKGLESGLRNDAPDDSIAMRQKWRLSEIGLEDYSFVLLSRFINALDNAGGSKWLASEAKASNVAVWNHPLGAAILGIRQLGLSGFQQGECLAIENELMTWQAAGIPVIEGKDEDVRLWALRLKATLDRARRLAEAYSDIILQLFPGSAEKLGQALGIPENTIRTYAEAEIRASVVFQLSKLCSLLLKALRSVTGGEGWDTLMPGVVYGTLLEVDRIVPGSIPKSIDGPVVLLVKESDGDEEVKASGANVVGLILQHELPHLSHLGVRARQEKVVFVTCDDEEKISGIRAWSGRTIKLEATPEGVHATAHNGPITHEKELAAVATKSAVKEKAVGDRIVDSTGVIVQPVKQSKVLASKVGVVLELADAVTETAGAKAASCGKLAVLAEQALNVSSDQGVPAAFKVPEGRVIPFGAMEEAISASGKLKEFHALVDKIEIVQPEGGELDKVCNELRHLVAAQRLPASVIGSIAKGFAADARLIVRSSANVEDLAGMSGAGLYDSIANVKASEPETFGKAVAEVWASLYTRRAVLSRRIAGVAQKDATMAVLVQQLLTPELSFVLHTVSPIDRNAKVVQAEVAVGLGETLASGTKGTPWRLQCNKFDGSVKTLAFANFSDELVVEAGGVADARIVPRVIDYSNKPLSKDAEYRELIGQRLATIGFFLEQKMGVAQDVEGCVVGKDIYIVQTRPQPE